MLFKIDITIDDREYLDFNLFWIFKAPNGAKRIRRLRTTLAVLLILAILALLTQTGISSAALLGLLPVLAVGLLMQLLLRPLLTWSLKSSIKAMKKNGKPGYSPNATLEFYEDRFVERTPLQTTELSYEVIERISVLEGKAIYIHLSSMSAHILPRPCFSSHAEYDGLLVFLKTKLPKIDYYF